MLGYKTIVRASYSKNLNKAIKNLKSLQRDRKKVLQYLEQGEKELLRKAQSITVKSESDERKVEKLFLTTEAIKFEIDRAKELGLLTNSEAEHYKWRYTQLKDEIKSIIKENARKEAEKKADELALKQLREVYGNLAEHPILSGKRAMLRSKYMSYYSDDVEKSEKAISKAESSVLTKLRNLLLRREKNEAEVVV